MLLLVIAAHPDDAEIAAGGTIAALVHAGHEVVVAVVTISELAGTAHLRRAAAERAARILGHQLRWMTESIVMHVTDVPDHQLVALVDELVADLRPDVVISHWDGDSHADHRALARAVLSSSRGWTATLLAMRPSEVRTPAMSAFSPTLFNDVTNTYDRKVDAVEQFTYDGQTFRHLDQDSLRRVESYYGALAGCELAEGFALLRQIGLTGQVGSSGSTP